MHPITRRRLKVEALKAEIERRWPYADLDLVSREWVNLVDSSPVDIGKWVAEVVDIIAQHTLMLEALTDELARHWPSQGHVEGSIDTLDLVFDARAARANDVDDFADPDAWAARWRDRLAHRLDYEARYYRFPRDWRAHRPNVPGVVVLVEPPRAPDAPGMTSSVPPLACVRMRIALDWQPVPEGCHARVSDIGWDCCQACAAKAGEEEAAAYALCYHPGRDPAEGIVLAYGCPHHPEMVRLQHEDRLRALRQAAMTHGAALGTWSNGVSRLQLSSVRPLDDQPFDPREPLEDENAEARAVRMARHLAEDAEFWAP